MDRLAINIITIKIFSCESVIDYFKLEEQIFIFRMCYKYVLYCIDQTRNLRKMAFY